MATTFERLWSKCYHDVFGGNDFTFFAAGTTFLMTVYFFAVAALFMYVDLTGKPKWMLQYKIQPGVNQPVDPNKLKYVIKIVSINQLFVGTPFLLVLYGATRYFGTTGSPEKLPSGWTILRDVFVSILYSEVYFYYSHRLSHWGPIYKRVHKLHHQWTSPLGVASLYCHPLEHIFVNMMTMGLCMFLLGAHIFTIWIWYIFSLTLTVVNHSDYHLPFWPIPPEFHDYHHMKFNGNYGSELGILDRLHGTDRGFRSSVYKKRNTILFGLQPANDLYPSPKKGSFHTKSG